MVGKKKGRKEEREKGRKEGGYKLRIANKLARVHNNYIFSYIANVIYYLVCNLVPYRQLSSGDSKLQLVCISFPSSRGCLGEGHIDSTLDTPLQHRVKLISGPTGNNLRAWLLMGVATLCVWLDW